MVGKWAPCFKKTKYDKCSIFKPSDAHANDVKDMGNIHKGHTKDLIIILGEPGNILDKNCHYSIENDLNFIAEMKSNTSVGSVNLFEGSDKLWMGGRVLSMNINYCDGRLHTLRMACT
jgi:hypothetical protein